MKATKQRFGANRLQALQAEALAAGAQKPAKPLASYFCAPAAPKAARAKPTTRDAAP